MSLSVEQSIYLLVTFWSPGTLSTYIGGSQTVTDYQDSRACWVQCSPTNPILARLRVSLASLIQLTMTITSRLTPTTLSHPYSHSLVAECLDQRGKGRNEWGVGLLVLWNNSFATCGTLIVRGIFQANNRLLQYCNKRHFNLFLNRCLLQVMNNPLLINNIIAVTYCSKCNDANGGALFLTPIPPSACEPILLRLKYVWFCFCCLCVFVSCFVHLLISKHNIYWFHQLEFAPASKVGLEFHKLTSRWRNRRQPS